MKYMGSKRAMLTNGLGELLAKEIIKARRFVDLFTGSAAVATHIARNYSAPVIAYDLQTYSTVLANAILGRREPFEPSEPFSRWHQRAQRIYELYKVPDVREVTPEGVESLRRWCAKQQDLPITRAYGGHYFSPKQAVELDSLRKCLPKAEPVSTVALAALIHAASQCAASPGHTAQPFQPTLTAKRFLIDAWKRDFTGKTYNAFRTLASQCSKRVGCAEVADANNAAETLRQGDLVFIDPPYSGVHYSRFYHVLETVAHGQCGVVSGIGRYPESSLRPKSKYSLQTQSVEALRDLVSTISSKSSRAIITFPDHDCSNGLTGEKVRQIASEYCTVREMVVESKFSTMGGWRSGIDRTDGRPARQRANELILILE